MLKKTVLIILMLVMALSLAQAKDLRAVKLQRFLQRYPWTPLKGHEHEILYCADKFGLDYRLYIAIAGAESSFGKRYPKQTKNLTGYNSCKTSFESIWENIYETSKLIGTAGYYKKFRQSGDIKDLIYVYKGVPPYDHYYQNMRYALDQITAVSIADELRKQREAMAMFDPASKQKLGKVVWLQKMFSWMAVRYDKYEARQSSDAGLKFAAKK